MARRSSAASRPTLHFNAKKVRLKHIYSYMLKRLHSNRLLMKATLRPTIEKYCVVTIPTCTDNGIAIVIIVGGYLLLGQRTFILLQLKCHKGLFFLLLLILALFECYLFQLIFDHIVGIWLEKVRAEERELFYLDVFCCQCRTLLFVQFNKCNRRLSRRAIIWESMLV